MSGTDHEKNLTLRLTHKSGNVKTCSVEEFTYDKRVSFIIIIKTYQGILVLDYIESDDLNSYRDIRNMTS